MCSGECISSEVFFELSGNHLDLHVLTHSFPTRRSSDLGSPRSAPPSRSRSRTFRARRGRGFRPGPASLRSSRRSEEHTSELQSLMRISYAVFCLKKKMHSSYRDPTYDARRDDSLVLFSHHARYYHRAFYSK